MTQDVTGKYGSARIFTNSIEGSALDQIRALLEHPIAEGCRVRIMPDVHGGKGCVIGYTSTLNNKVVPNLVGVDLGCGVAAWKLPVTRIDFDDFDEFVRDVVPSGFEIHAVPPPNTEEVIEFCGESYDGLVGRVEVIVRRYADDDTFDQHYSRVIRSIGTLGGGNHFIEIDKDQSGAFWLVIHSGSRNFGLQVATHYQKLAVQKHLGSMRGLEYLDGALADEYLEAAGVAQKYALINRSLMADSLLAFFDSDVAHCEKIESVHNYIDLEHRIVRKGAISAQLGERVIIPLTMADGCVIGTGKGIEDWNWSAPHGAGRIMSRTKAKESIDLDVYRKRMREAHVWSSCISKGTLDESPMAYKRPKAILEALSETVDIEQTMKPVYNFKAGGE